MKFNDLNLSDPILRSLKDQNYKKPTPIQAEVIPAVLNNSDIMAAAQTGTGKTAAFVLPILSKLSNPQYKYKGHQLRALIVTPTRELAAQVRESVKLAYLAAGWLIAFKIINPWQPIVRMIIDVLARIHEPLLRPVRRILPDFGALDVSPIVLFLLAQFLRNLLQSSITG